MIEANKAYVPNRRVIPPNRTPTSTTMSIGTACCGDPARSGGARAPRGMWWATSAGISRVSREGGPIRMSAREHAVDRDVVVVLHPDLPLVLTGEAAGSGAVEVGDRKSTRLNSSHFVPAPGGDRKSVV